MIVYLYNKTYVILQYNVSLKTVKNTAKSVKKSLLQKIESLFPTSLKLMAVGVSQTVHAMSRCK